MKTIEIYFEGLLIKSIEVNKDSDCKLIDLGNQSKILVSDTKTIADVPNNYLVIFNN